MAGIVDGEIFDERDLTALAIDFDLSRPDSHSRKRASVRKFETASNPGSRTAGNP